jgi:hypothetical protein
MAISNLLTGRVRVVSPKNVTSDRYQFLDLSQAEPNLGVPPFSASLLTNPAIIVSDDQGNRGFAKKLFLEEFSGSFSGSFQGDGSKLTNVPSVIAPFIASGSFTASFGDNGLNVNTNTAVSGNLSILGDANVAGNLYVSKSIFADQLIVNIISSSVIYSSGSNIFGDEITDVQQFTGSVEVRDRIGVNQITGSSISASFTGSFFGDGRNLFNLPQATRLATGSITASVSPEGGFKVLSVVSGSTFTGSLFVSGNINIPSGSGFFSGSGEGLFNIPLSALNIDSLVASKIASGSVTASVAPDKGLIVVSKEFGSQFTGSINVSGSISASMFTGSGRGLFDIPQSALSEDATLIASGSVTASVTPQFGFRVISAEIGSQFTGSLFVSGGNIRVETGSFFSGSGKGLSDIPRSALAPDALLSTLIVSGSVTASVNPQYGFRVESALSGSEFTGSVDISGNISASLFVGDGSGLFNLPALTATLISSGSATASISPNRGLSVNTFAQFDFSVSASMFSGSGKGLFDIPLSALAEQVAQAVKIATGSVTASVSPNFGFTVISNEVGSQFTGSLRISGSVSISSGSSFSGSGKNLFDIPESALSFFPNKIVSGSVTASLRLNLF